MAVFVPTCQDSSSIIMSIIRRTVLSNRLAGVWKAYIRTGEGGSGKTCLPFSKRERERECLLAPMVKLRGCIFIVSAFETIDNRTRSCQKSHQRIRPRMLLPMLDQLPIPPHSERTSQALKVELFPSFSPSRPVRLTGGKISRGLSWLVNKTTSRGIQ